jgi:creatinine amidohydrolase
MNRIENILTLTWKELEELPKEKTILFLTFAPIEEHSHHLPLGVDIILGENWRDRTIKLLFDSNNDYCILTISPIPFAQGSINGFPGNIHLKQKTIYHVAYGILKDIADWGIKNIIIIASHGEPKHLIAIEEACDRINKKYGICSISPMGAFFSYNELGIDLNFPKEMQEILNKYPNDFHAGWIETSSILDINESYVKSNYIDLPDIKVEEKDMIFQKKINKKIAGYGHIGFPRLANKEIGKLINDNVVEYLFKAMKAFVSRGDYKIYMHHSLYKIPFLRTFFVRNASLIIGSIFVLIIVFLMLLCDCGK